MSNSQKMLAVFAGGVATSLLTLVFSWFLSNSIELNLMGLYILFIVPVGPILVGALAGSGYGITAKVLNVKVLKSAFVVMVGLQLLVYFGTQYVEFWMVVDGLRAQLAPEALADPEVQAFLNQGFLEFFDAGIRSATFDGSDELGGLGYAFALLEIAGFVGGGFVALGLTRGTEYCEKCKVYKKTTSLAIIPGSYKPAKVKKKDVEGGAAEEARQDAVWQRAMSIVEDLMNALANGQPGNARQAVDQAKAMAAEKEKMGAISISLKEVFCPTCFDGYLVATRIIVQGDNRNEDGVGVQNVDANLHRAIHQ